MTAERSERVRKVALEERARLRDFIRARVPSDSDAEDILQDVFSQLAALVEPVEAVAAWLYRVARNRIVDAYRRKKPASLADLEREDEEGTRFGIEEWLPGRAETPEDAYLRSLVWEEIEHALAELPDAQREVFIGHEIEGLSFRDMAERTGEKVATLISRKRYAILFLRRRLSELAAAGDDDEEKEES